MTTATKTQVKKCTLCIIVKGIGWQPITNPAEPMTRDECWDHYVDHRHECPDGTEFGIHGDNWKRDGDKWRMTSLYPLEA